jgi:hypothetical protein
MQGHYEPVAPRGGERGTNAVAFTDGTGIAVDARRDARRQITVRGRPQVPDEMKDASSAYVTNRKGGTGLGLALVRQTVLAHSGRVAVSDAPGGGAALPSRFREGMTPACSSSTTTATFGGCCGRCSREGYAVDERRRRGRHSARGRRRARRICSTW